MASLRLEIEPMVWIGNKRIGDQAGRTLSRRQALGVLLWAVGCECRTLGLPQPQSATGAHLQGSTSESKASYLRAERQTKHNMRHTMHPKLQLAVNCFARWLFGCLATLGCQICLKGQPNSTLQSARRAAPRHSCLLNRWFPVCLSSLSVSSPA